MIVAFGETLASYPGPTGSVIDRHSDTWPFLLEQKLRHPVRNCLVGSEPIAHALDRLQDDCRTGDFAAIMERVARAERVPFVNIFAAFRQHPQWNEDHNPLVEDGRHPSAVGNQLWAQHLAEKLIPLLRVRSGAVRRYALAVRRRSPDRAVSTTAGLPTRFGMGDLRSALSAGSGDPRTTREHPST